MTMVLLAVIVCVAWFVQTLTGFGAMLIAISLGLLMVPELDLLAVLLPLSLAQPLYLMWAERRHVQWSLLLRQVMPFMGLGVLVGALLSGLLGGPWLRRLFGLCVLTLSLMELWKRRAPESAVANTASMDRRWLGIAGVIHGLYVTGGPPLVYALGRAPLTKEQLRATLACVWVCFNSLLVGVYVVTARLTETTLTQSVWMVPAMLVAMVVGEWAHARVSEQRFRVMLYALLSVAGLTLMT